MGNPVSHSQYTAQQINAAVGKSPIIQDGYWFVWDIASMRYVSTGTVAAAANYSEAARQSAQSAAASANTATEKAAEAVAAASTAAQDAADEAAREAASQAAEQTSDAIRSEMQGYASDAADSAEDAEAWAVGQRGGADVTDADETYHNNSKYWAGIAEQAAGGGVTSFNERTGTVVPQSGDYTAEMVGAYSAEEMDAALALKANAADVVPNTRTVNGKALSSNITLSASDVSAVPTTRTINGKALSANITLSASDVGAAASGDVFTKAQTLTNATAAKLRQGYTTFSPAVGDTVKLNVGGVATDFIVVHKGLPSSLYDSSCNGLWLLQADVDSSMVWGSSTSTTYPNSTIHSYLNNTWINKLDTGIQALVKQVKIPYKQASTVYSGANGVSAKAFILGGYEVGFTTSQASALSVDGAKLDYFTAGVTDEANALRVVASGAVQRLRSPHTTATTSTTACITAVGKYATESRTASTGVRPCIILPSTIYIWDDGSWHDAAPANPSTPDEAFNNIGVTLSLLGGSAAKIQTGSYVGTGTYGSDNPCSITFDFPPKLVFGQGGRGGTGQGTGWGSNNTITDTGNGAFGYGLIPMEHLTTSFQSGYGFGFISSTSLLARCSEDGKTLYWYATSYSSTPTEARHQANSTGEIYRWVAIG